MANLAVVSFIESLVTTLGLYLDAGKTIRAQEVETFRGNGVRTRFIARQTPAVVFVDNVRQTKLTINSRLIEFKTPPANDSLVVLVPVNSVAFFLDNSISEEVTVPVWVTLKDRPAWLLSHNQQTGKLGSLLFSLDNLAFTSCVALTQDAQVYVKASSASGGVIETLVHDRLALVEVS